MTRKRKFTYVPCKGHKMHGWHAWDPQVTRRLKAGVRQVQCEICGLWLWPGEE